jgi:hypothetical protein
MFTIVTCNREAVVWTIAGAFAGKRFARRFSRVAAAAAAAAAAAGGGFLPNMA